MLNSAHLIFIFFKAATAAHDGKEFMSHQPWNKHETKGNQASIEVNKSICIIHKKKKKNNYLIRGMRNFQKKLAPGLMNLSHFIFHHVLRLQPSH